MSDTRLLRHLLRLMPTQRAVRPMRSSNCPPGCGHDRLHKVSVLSGDRPAFMAYRKHMDEIDQWLATKVGPLTETPKDWPHTIRRLGPFAVLYRHELRLGRDSLVHDQCEVEGLLHRCELHQRAPRIVWGWWC